MNLEDYENIEFTEVKDKLKIEDKWIISKLNSLEKEVNSNIDNFDLGIALDKIYTFIWDEFCDWYIEMVKPRLYNKLDETRKTAQYVLNRVMVDSLKLLHPFIPFVTEEIYTKLYGTEETIISAEYPQCNEGLEFIESEKQIETIKELITGIRNVRTEMNVHPSKKSKLIILSGKYDNAIEQSVEFIKKLGFAETIEISGESGNIPEGAVQISTGELKAYIPFEELVDPKEEIKRLENEKAKILVEKEKTDKILGQPGFAEKAPKERVQAETEKQAKLNEQIRNIEERIKELM
jgi:valyl-tRNA synthetase